MVAPHKFQPLADHVNKALPGLFALSGEGEWLQLVDFYARVPARSPARSSLWAPRAPGLS